MKENIPDSVVFSFLKEILYFNNRDQIGKNYRKGSSLTLLLNSCFLIEGNSVTILRQLFLLLVSFVKMYQIEKITSHSLLYYPERRKHIGASSFRVSLMKEIMLKSFVY